MHCKWTRRLSAYLADDLSAKKQASVEAHLAECEVCRRELAELRRLNNLLHSMPPPEPPPGFAADTLRLMAQEFTPAPVRVRPAFSLRPVLAAAAGVACLLAIVLVWNTSSPTVDTLPSPAVSHHAPAPSFAPAESNESATVVSPPSTVSEAAAAEPLPPRRFGEVAARPRPSASPAAATVRAPQASAEAATEPQAEETAPDITTPDYAAVSRELAHTVLYAGSGDVDLQLAALENVATAHPDTPHAARALMTVGDTQRRRGRMADADGAYHKALKLPGSNSLVRAQAHKSLADLRRENVGDDEIVAYHYAQAMQELREKTQNIPEEERLAALLALGETARSAGHRDEALANYVEASQIAVAKGNGADVMKQLAEIL